VISASVMVRNLMPRAAGDKSARTGGGLLRFAAQCLNEPAP
jgi:hypothetical protein